jgi:hypothetical protein
MPADPSDLPRNIRVGHGDDAIPHMYGQKTLCLYRPSKNEWDSTMSLADTIQPWASLCYFIMRFGLRLENGLAAANIPGKKNPTRALQLMD